MSAGEQKVFMLLEKIFRAGKYSLILIEEIDLLLHDLAMRNLLKIIVKRCEDKNLQVVFTTHRESILELSDVINIRHICATPEKTLCFNETKPDAINRLTGKKLTPIEVFVEDNLAAAIVNKVAGQLGISRHIAIQRFGAAINCFTVLAGLFLTGESCENSIFILDGDVHKTREEQEKQLKNVLTGDDASAKDKRQLAIEKIISLNLPENVSPEKYIHRIIISLPNNENQEYNEIIKVAKEIESPEDKHEYVNAIIRKFNWDRKVGLSKIVDLISLAEEWNDYVASVRDWLSSKKDIVEESSNN